MLQLYRGHLTYHTGTFCFIQNTHIALLKPEDDLDQNSL